MGGKPSAPELAPSDPATSIDRGVSRGGRGTRSLFFRPGSSGRRTSGISPALKLALNLTEKAHGGIPGLFVSRPAPTDGNNPPAPNLIKFKPALNQT